MNRKFLTVVMGVSLLSGCASVPMASQEKSDAAKEFNAPSDEMAGIYIYRKNSPVGAALKKDLWIDGECVGQTAKGVFFYEEVMGDEKHVVSTESEFSPNTLAIKPDTGDLYFIEQYIKMGVFVGGANVRRTDAEIGREEVAKLGMAKQGTCRSDTTAEASAE